MAIFDRFRKKSGSAKETKEETPSKELAAVKKQKASQAETETETTLIKAQLGNELSFRLLRRPHVSERAARQTERNVYVFDVPVSAEKISIRKAVESLYKVNVIGVRTIRHAGKPVYRGRRPGVRNAWKKALVTLAPGQKIDLYEGV
ncbi:MAG TPA: 50S ribosomal protein L23 [Patescibacteria group bacterium]|nr:50S ribosomal protein L23 [Patescibacteria group bacterium]